MQWTSTVEVIPHVTPCWLVTEILKTVLLHLKTVLFLKVVVLQALVKKKMIVLMMSQMCGAVIMPGVFCQSWKEINSWNHSLRYSMPIHVWRISWLLSLQYLMEVCHQPIFRSSFVWKEQSGSHWKLQPRCDLEMWPKNFGWLCIDYWRVRE